MEMVFEWDEEKEKINIKKHGMDFEFASYVFYDEKRIERYDSINSQYEGRFITIGRVGQIIAVIYTERMDAIRIISARYATKSEREEYYNGY